MVIRVACKAAVLATAAISSAASASVTITGESGNPALLTSKIQYTPGGIGGVLAQTQLAVYTGRTQLTGYVTGSSPTVNVTFDSYCVDIFNYLSHNNAQFDVGNLVLSSATKTADLRKLLLSTANDIATAGSSTQAKRRAAAIQLAVWEIVNEATNSYSLSSGLFSVDAAYGSVVTGSGTGVNASALTLAQGYLDGLGSAVVPVGSRLRTLEAINPRNNQRQVFITAVPEPSTWAMLIAGFGVVGSAMRSRRRGKMSFA